MTLEIVPTNAEDNGISIPDRDRGRDFIGAKDGLQDLIVHDQGSRPRLRKIGSVINEPFKLDGGGHNVQFHGFSVFTDNGLARYE